MKSIHVALVALVASLLGASAFADHNHFPPPPAWPPHHPHFVVVHGEGKGGTTHGDKAAACDRAAERASWDAREACDQYRGWIRDEDYSSCTCKKKKGSKDDYNCEIRVRATCEY